MFNSIQHWSVFHCASLPEINHKVVLCVNGMSCMCNGTGFSCSSVSFCLSCIIESVTINEVSVNRNLWTSFHITKLYLVFLILFVGYKMLPSRSAS